MAFRGQDFLKVTAITTSRPITRTRALEFLVGFLLEQQEPSHGEPRSPAASSAAASWGGGGGVETPNALLMDDVWQVARSLTETESERALLAGLGSSATTAAAAGAAAKTTTNTTMKIKVEDESPEHGAVDQQDTDTTVVKKENDDDEDMDLTAKPHEISDDRQAKEAKKAAKRARKEVKKAKKAAKKAKKESSQKLHRQSLG